MQKSLNQQWKESGTTLNYKEWRRREDDKMASFDGIASIPSPKLQDSANFKKTQEEMQTISGFKSDVSHKTFLGIQNKYLFIGAFIVIGAIGYKLYKKYNK
jgi:hypothetical protein